jgi:hypothetical protein
MNLYAQAPLAYPALHVHLYVLIDTEVSVDESEHVAPFLHGLLAHSFTSMLQFPPRVLLALLSLIVHCVLYCEMKA